jgi:hypothetical protein
MSLEANTDLFGIGRDALAAARRFTDGQACFTSCRRLQPDGSWHGPSTASQSLVSQDVLASVGGQDGAQTLGANAVLCHATGALLAEVIDRGMRCLVQVPYAAAEPVELRARRLSDLRALIEQYPGVDGIVPTPQGEAQGIDTIQFFAACRLACPSLHVIVDLELLGHKLGQLCLSFGADELMGAILKQRELRLGARASSNEITRDEATLLLRASGFEPRERMADGTVRAP